MATYEHVIELALTLHAALVWIEHQIESLQSDPVFYHDFVAENHDETRSPNR